MMTVFNFRKKGDYYLMNSFPGADLIVRLLVGTVILAFVLICIMEFIKWYLHKE